MQYVSVRVVNAEGRPQHYVRVGIQVHQFLAGGFKDEYTNTDGLAEFQLDLDSGAEITIYANGDEKVRRASVKAAYTLVV